MLQKFQANRETFLDELQDSETEQPSESPPNDPLDLPILNDWSRHFWEGLGGLCFFDANDHRNIQEEEPIELEYTSSREKIETNLKIRRMRVRKLFSFVLKLKGSGVDYKKVGDCGF